MTISMPAKNNNPNLAVASNSFVQKAFDTQRDLALASASPKEAVTLSPAAKTSLAEQKADAAFAAGTKAFGNLKDADRAELAGKIQMQLSQLGDRRLSESQSNDIKAQATVQWLDQREQAGTLPAGYQALDAAAHDYQTARQEVGTLAPLTASRTSDIGDFFPAGSEIAKDTKSVGYFKKGLDAFDKLSDADRRDLTSQIASALDQQGGLSSLSLETANSIRATVATDWSRDPAFARNKDGNISALGAFAFQYNESRYNYLNPGLGN